MALATVQGVFDPGFKGSMSKAVRTSNSPKISKAGRTRCVPISCMKKVDAGRMWGPFRYSPFRYICQNRPPQSSPQVQVKPVTARVPSDQRFVTV